MLVDVDAHELCSIPAARHKQTWWLAVVNPENSKFDRACFACGSLDCLTERTDLEDAWDFVLQCERKHGAEKMTHDTILNTMRNILATTDHLHPTDAPADVAVCKICSQWLQQHTSKAFVPLHVVQCLLRHAQQIPGMRSTDMRVVYRLCGTLSERGMYGCNPYLACFYEEEQSVIKRIAESDIACMRPIIAEHFFRQNNCSGYLPLKAVEFLRQYLLEDGIEGAETDELSVHDNGGAVVCARVDTAKKAGATAANILQPSANGC